jgi:hypothetical protein
MTSDPSAPELQDSFVQVSQSPAPEALSPATADDTAPSLPSEPPRSHPGSDESAGSTVPENNETVSKSGESSTTSLKHDDLQRDTSVRDGKIRRAVARRDVQQLRELAVEPYGFQTNELRQLVWSEVSHQMISLY